MTGRFLDSLDLHGWRSAARWRDEVDDEISSSLIQQGRTETQRALEAADWPRAARLAESLLKWSPSDPDLNEYHVLALAGSGCENQAFARLGDWSRRLVEDHGDAGDRRARSVGEKLAALKRRAQTLPAKHQTIRFVGRHTEFAALRDAWEATQPSGHAVAVVSGAAGIGKTRLARHFGRYAAIKGAYVAEIRCVAAERYVPYAAARHIAITLISGNEHNERREPTLHRLAGVEIAENPAPWPTSLDIAGALNKALGKAAAARPLVVLIDDVHWIDLASWAVVAGVFRDVDARSSMLLVTHRRNEPQTTLTVSELVSLSPVQTWIELNELPFGEANQLIDAFEVEHELRLPPRTRGQLLESGRGHPFLLSSLLHAQLVAPAPTRAPTSGSLQSSEIAEIAHYVRSRLAALTDGAIGVARALAILNRDADLSELCGAASLTVPEALRFATELIEHEIIEYTNGRFRFRHDLIRESVEAQTPASTRALLNLNAAKSAEARGSESGIIAWHYAAAGHPEHAVEAAVAASTLALERRAFREAEHFISFVRRCAVAPPHVAAGKALYLRYLVSTNQFAAAHLVVGENGASGVAPAQRLIEYAAAVDSCAAPADELAAGARDVLRDMESEEELSKALIAAAEAAHNSAKQNLVAMFLPEFIEYTHLLTRTDLRVECLSTGSRLACLWGEIDAAAAWANEAIRIAESDDPVSRASALAALGIVEYYRGNVNEFARLLEDAHASAVEGGVQRHVRRTRLALAVARMEGGSHEEAERILQELQDACTQNEELFLLANRAVLAYEAQDASLLLKVTAQLRESNRTASAGWADLVAASLTGLGKLMSGADATEEYRLVSGRCGFPSGQGDDSYLHLFVSGWLAYTDGERAALDHLRSAIEATRHTIGRLRLQLYEAHLFLAVEPITGVRTLHSVIDRAQACGAGSVVRRATALMRT